MTNYIIGFLISAGSRWKALPQAQIQSVWFNKC